MTVPTFMDTCDRCGAERRVKLMHLVQWQGWPGAEFKSEFPALICRGCARRLGIRWTYNANGTEIQSLGR